MKNRRLPPVSSGWQMNLLFEMDKLDGLDHADRTKAVLAMAQTLMQAAGVQAEELADDQR